MFLPHPKISNICLNTIFHFISYHSFISYMIYQSEWGWDGCFSLSSGACIYSKGLKVMWLTTVIHFIDAIPRILLFLHFLYICKLKTGLVWVMRLQKFQRSFWGESTWRNQKKRFSCIHREIQIGFWNYANILFTGLNGG